MSTSSTARTSSARTAATSSSGRGAGAWVLITGATAGIGRTTALHLARAGYRVIATGRKVHELEALATEARAAGADLDTLSLDVTSASSIAAAASAVDTLTGGAGLDVLVNNAGFGLIGPLVEVDDAGLRRQYDTNVFGLMAVTRAFLPTMMARRRGRVINVSSVGGRMTFPFMGAYNSTKYAVESLSDALRFELRPFGVDVVLIEPGVIRTNFTDTAMGGLDASTSSAYAASLRKADQLRARMEATAVGPEHVARAITRAIRARRPSASLHRAAPDRAGAGGQGGHADPGVGLEHAAVQLPRRQARPRRPGADADAGPARPAEPDRGVTTSRLLKNPCRRLLPTGRAPCLQQAARSKMPSRMLLQHPARAREGATQSFSRTIHPRGLRCSSVTYRRVCSLVAPCPRGASFTSSDRLAPSRALTARAPRRPAPAPRHPARPVAPARPVGGAASPCPSSTSARR